MARFMAFLYGLVAYILFFGTFLYAMGFVGNVFVPKSIDSGEGSFSVPALVIDALLRGLFATQHSLMARRWFKDLWTKVIPKPIERSTYVLMASLCLDLLYWQWSSLTEVVSALETSAGHTGLASLFWVGWLTVLGSTFMVSH